MVEYLTEDSKEKDKQNNKRQSSLLLLSNKRKVCESEDGIKISSSQNNSNTSKKSTATLLHINALKLEESKVNIDMTKVVCGTNEQQQQQQQKQMDTNKDNILNTQKVYYHDEANINHLTISSSTAFSSSPKGDMNNTTTTTTHRSSFIIPVDNSTLSSSSQDLSCASSFSMYRNAHDDDGKRNNNNSSQDTIIISDQHENDLKLTKHPHKKISMSNNNNISNRTKRMISVSTKNCPISTPNTIYFLHNSRERSCTGTFSIYYKSITNTNKMNNCNNTDANNPIAFKLKLKSSASNFHFAAKPAIGFIYPGEKIEIQVTVHKLPQLFDSHNDQEEYDDGGEEKEKYFNRSREKNTNNNIFTKDMLVLFTTLFTNDLMSTIKTTHPCSGNMTDLKRVWKTLEKERSELITSHLLKRLVLVRENGDVYFSNNCTHNIYEAMSLSQPYFNKTNNDEKNVTTSKGAISNMGLTSRRKQLQTMENEDKTTLILHHLKLILLEIQDSQKMTNYTLTIQCIIFIMCLFFMVILSANYYIITGPH